MIDKETVDEDRRRGRKSRKTLVTGATVGERYHVPKADLETVPTAREGKRRPKKQMPKPADTNWGTRSDNEYEGDARRNNPLILSTPQALNQAKEPTAKFFQGPGDE